MGIEPGGVVGDIPPPLPELDATLPAEAPVQ